MSRLMRGAVALIALLLGLIGVPLALVVLGGNPLPAELSWAGITQALFSPDDGTILLGLITIIAWVAWLVFALSVLSELVALASRERLRFRVPGLGGPQRVAAGLLVSVLAMVSAPQIGTLPTPAPLEAAAAPVTSEPSVSAEESPAVATAASTEATPDPDRVMHKVTVGDDLWSLAERYYGDGRDWRKIARANPDVLTGGPDRLEPGWKLAIPDIEAPAEQPGERMVTVRRGDTLSAIAERELGTAEKWQVIYRLNRAQLSDPDELAAGLRLRLPQAKPAPAVDARSQRSGGPGVAAAHDEPWRNNERRVNPEPDARPRDHRALQCRRQVPRPRRRSAGCRCSSAGRRRRPAGRRGHRWAA